MNKKQALEKCRDQWKYMAETGAVDKSVYFGNKNTPECLCYCCSYGRKRANDYNRKMGYKVFHESYVHKCKFCPLNDFAWPSYQYSCESSSKSLYKKWATPYSKYERQKYAQKIVDACEKALEELNNS